MTQNNPGSLSCVVASWCIAALVGALVAVLLMTIAGYGFVASAFLGGIAFVIAALVFMWAFCRSLPAPNTVEIETPAAGPSDAKAQAMAEMAAKSDATASASASASAATADPAPAAAKTAATATAAASTTAASKVKPSAALAGEAELAERKGDWKYDGDAASTTPAGIADIPAEKPAAKKKPAAKAAKPAAKAELKAKAAAKKAPAKSAEKAPAKEKAPTKAKAPAKAAAKKPAAAKAADSGPEVLTGPRDGGVADDLKQLKGVGPGLEKTLNELGFFHFDQVAKWKKKDIAWVDSRLKFKGRIERDDWVSQAKVLAKGGTTEFSKKVKKGGVY